jgi:hypothetical protein
MYELRDEIKNRDSLNRFWKDLDILLQDEGWRIVCRPFEDALQKLDSAAWEFLKKEASVYLTRWDKKNLRGQQQLFDILNQAKAYKFLKDNMGCSEIHFIPRAKIKRVKTPDLEGEIGQVKIICEVKTINISDDEALLRSDSFRDDDTWPKLEQVFFDKLIKDIDRAKEQIATYVTGIEARRIVYLIVNFDDFWGEFKENYFQQIDQYLCENIVHGIEIVFHNQRTAFHKAISMKCATVINEPGYS